MTVIVWDGKTLEADRQGSVGDTTVTRSKLHHFENGDVAASFGATDFGLMLMRWLEEGAFPEKWPAFQRTSDWTGLVLWHAGQILEFNQEPVGIPCEDPYMAWGSGAHYALGALAMGATAAQAVEAASKHCASCGRGVDTFEAP